MEQRKYFKYRITELEDLYNKELGDIAVLEELEEELSHRSTQRAQKLLDAVQKSLDGSNPPTENVNVPPETSNDDNQITTTPILKTPLVDNNTQEAPPEINWDTVLDGADDAIPIPNGEPNEKPVTNKPSDIIDTWTILEALSPQSYKTPKDLIIGQGSVAYLKQGQEPWVRGEKSRPSCNLYYMLYLGGVDLEKATQKLLALYQDKRVERPSIKGLSAIGVVLLDKKGVPVPDTGLALSSFGWAYARALQGKLDELKCWEVAEKALKEGLEKIIYRTDEDGKPLPLSLEQAQKAYQWILKNCEIPHEDTTVPNFSIRLFQPFSKGEPEPPLLNSFYLDDLQRAKNAVITNSAGTALSRYLGISEPEHRYDILKSKEYIEVALQPKYMPAARWPGNGRHSLVLLQQTAVNLANIELKNGGLFSVNGPPGTGKTTLLRDVVSSVLVERAKALCAFTDTDSAFEHAGSMKLGNSFVHLYKLDETLRGHEILVASTNNKAVENVSKELPLKAQIAEDIGDFQYFKTISDALSKGEEETWGLSASVLGNSKNRGEFINKAWWDYHSGLRSYFMSITGQLNYEVDEDGEEIIPRIVEECDPPLSIEDAKRRWKEARTSFNAALSKAQEAINKSQAAYESLISARKIKVDIEDRLSKSNIIKSKINKLKTEKEHLQTNLDQENKRLEEAQIQTRQSNDIKPGFFKRIFAREEWKKWKTNHDQLVLNQQQIDDDYDAAKTKFKECTSKLLNTQSSLSEIQHQIQSYQTEYDALLAKVNVVSSICGEKLVTNELWTLNHEDQQTFSPNFTDEAQRLRDDVFVEAVRLHKAFIDASSKQLRQNLGAFFSCLSGKALPEDKQALLPHLWSSAFLVTPVISTAFASVGRMLKSMPKESIGWLLIDEAGQATPQAAIGAIYRAKRVMCVGDPLQIEPVVTLPSALVEGISKHIGVDPQHWMAPDASVQTLSDQANKFGTTIPRELSEIRIGTPLLVHRRCEDPMFTISNRLAYNGLMVQATQPKPSDITTLYGMQTQWFDIRGGAQEKWSPEEGDFVADMLLKRCAESGGNPEMFVISPFRIVAERMGQRMRQEENRLKSLGMENPSDWIYNNIGTVHTFQGKETKAVILLLGAPSPAQNGARAWATSNVNLLNVAVSRAKQNFYVVVNKELWGDIGHMKIISRYIK